MKGPLPTPSSQDKAMMMECADEDMDALGDALSNLTVKVPASISFGRGGRGGRGRGRKGGARGTWPRFRLRTSFQICKEGLSVYICACTWSMNCNVLHIHFIKEVLSGYSQSPCVYVWMFVCIVSYIHIYIHLYKCMHSLLDVSSTDNRYAICM